MPPRVRKSRRPITEDGEQKENTEWKTVETELKKMGLYTA